MSLLSEFQNYSRREWQKMDLGLHRMEKVCEALGHPEKSFRSIHVAGSNGKGSVSAMLHSVLSEAGYRVGLFTSPHLVRVNERFRVGEEEISDGELEECLRQIVGARFPRPGPGDLAPTFFELCTLIGFLFFVRKKVDVAILEVGLGGRLDATNMVTPLVSVITEISLDHTEILGPDLASIAREKAGIIKPGVPVVCGATAPEAREAIRGVAEEKKAPVVWVRSEELGVRSIPHLTPYPLRLTHFDWGPLKNLQIGLPGSHQIHNAAIALTTLQALGDVGAYRRTPLQVNETAIREGLQKVRWPGRLEFLQEDPPVILDGAHNPAGMKALVEFLGGFPKEWKVLFSAMKDKDVAEMLSILKELSPDITVCKMQNARSMDSSQTGDAFEIFQTMRKELKREEGLVVTGSLYLVGEIKKGLV